MAFQSLPNQSVAVPLSHQQFETLQKAVFGIDNLLFIVRQASWGPEGSVAHSIESLVNPYVHDLFVLRDNLDKAFEELEKARQAEETQDPESPRPAKEYSVEEIHAIIDRLAGREGGAA